MKNKVIILRINEVEKTIIKQKADKLNMSISEYIRFISINGEIKKND
jgi:hypothetical protein